MFSQIKTLIQYRHLVCDLAIKDIEVRYRSPVLGFLWAIIIPFVTVYIFNLVFSVILKIEVESYPFALYLMTAVFPWAYFSSSVSAATESMVTNGELIKKTYFPRHIIPVSVVLANLLNFFPAVIAMLICMYFFGAKQSFLILLLPLIILLQTFLTIGLALMLSSFQVIFRDTKYAVELGMIVWFYLCPVFYSLTLVADISTRFFEIYKLNPFVGLLILYRSVLLDGYAKSLAPSVNIFFLTVWTIAVCLGTFFLGFFVFKKYESRFADLV
jgi:ABC-type polysaccharide/polyol phosphate export permease